MKPCSFWEPGQRKAAGTVRDRSEPVLRCARGMIPLESRMREIRMSGSEGRGWKRAHGSRTEHRSESNG